MGGSPGAKTVGCCDDRPAQRGVPAVPRSVDVDQLRARPGAVHAHGEVRRAAQVRAAVDQHARNAGQPICPAHQFVLLEPRVMTPVVGHQASESHTEAGVGEPRVLPWSGGGSDVPLLPGAPLSGSSFPPRWCPGGNGRAPPRPGSTDQFGRSPVRGHHPVGGPHVVHDYRDRRGQEDQL